MYLIINTKHRIDTNSLKYVRRYRSEIVDTITTTTITSTSKETIKIPKLQTYTYPTMPTHTAPEIIGLTEHIS